MSTQDDDNDPLTKATKVTVIVTALVGAAVNTAGTLIAAPPILVLAVIALLSLLGVLVLAGATF